MRLAVIGEPCIDYIHQKDTIPSCYLGGILYSVLSLAAIAGDNDQIIPVMNIGEDEFDRITSVLKNYKNINTAYIKRVGHKTRIVNLYYKNTADEPDKSKCHVTKTYDREENSTEPTFPIEFNDIAAALCNSDGLLINMVSGVDITLETLLRISAEFRGYIHLDLHNVVMKTLPDGRRIQGKVEKWQEWCTAPDTLQLNTSELNVLTGENISGYKAAERILFSDSNSSRTKALVLTDGKRGAAVYEKKEKVINNQKYYDIDRYEVTSIERNDFKDSTGCGDVFASGFFYKNVSSKGANLLLSLNYANKLASINTSLAGAEELYKLKIK